MTAPRFVHLRLHTEYSVVDGMARVDDVVAAAAEDGMPALAITDAANVFGAIKFFQAARGKGVQPIIGCDLSIDVLLSILAHHYDGRGVRGLE